MELRKTKILTLKDNVSEENILIKEISVALLWEIEEGNKKDDLKTIIKECTNIDKEMYKKMGITTANKIYDEIFAITYGSTSLTNPSEKDAERSQEVTERSRSKKKIK